MFKCFCQENRNEYRYMMWIDLPILVEKSHIWGLEFAFLLGRSSISWNATHSCCGFLASTESKGVDSVRVWEETVFFWICLDILPACVRPSARDQLEIFLWDANLLFTKIWIIEASRLLWPCSSMTCCRSWHFYVTLYSFSKQTYEILHYKI